MAVEIVEVQDAQPEGMFRLFSRWGKLHPLCGDDLGDGRGGWVADQQKELGSLGPLWVGHATHDTQPSRS
jgi:hypothetical protein